MSCKAHYVELPIQISGTKIRTQRSLDKLTHTQWSKEKSPGRTPPTKTPKMLRQGFQPILSILYRYCCILTSLCCSAFPLQDFQQRLSYRPIQKRLSYLATHLNITRPTYSYKDLLTKVGHTRLHSPASLAAFLFLGLRTATPFSPAFRFLATPFILFPQLLAPQ